MIAYVLTTVQSVFKLLTDSRLNNMVTFCTGQECEDLIGTSMCEMHLAKGSTCGVGFNDLSARCKKTCGGCSQG